MGGVSVFSPSVSPSTEALRPAEGQLKDPLQAFPSKQHVGTHSLAGKIQKLKVGSAVLELVTQQSPAELGRGGEAGPVGPPEHLCPPPLGQGLWEARVADNKHVNPPAEVSTSLKTHQHFTLEKAYLHGDFFLGSTPSAGDPIRPRFFQPLHWERSVPAPQTHFGGGVGGYRS